MCEAEVPDNSFAGFIINAKNDQSTVVKENIGVLYGKEFAYLKVETCVCVLACSIISYIIFHHIQLKSLQFCMGTL